jgi:hypothetical protein
MCMGRWDFCLSAYLHCAGIFEANFVGVSGLEHALR